MELPAPFHGPHVPVPAEDATRITWMAPTPRCARIMVIRHTCECRMTIYELCQAGGLRFIRRTARKASGMAVHETTWMQTAKAARLWTLLLEGRAK
ncbi:hypothetical protein Pth03_12160 [Planotetraspora thailandica]|uniref:Uncharacterized protein n=1 Tax=Planotetraspora thailandica TaxID=487172 RepID=A0A8J3UZP0_9ACTN|nr:hypothetical protein [Planotetraspora thailandica]GII52827.1 hypothetical protein Pth03_12160 [Planotetraspora thailandica]